jgi:muramoyltetrapeptide carboxypeptidase
LPYIDWDIVRANPKLLIGYSDITALHMAIAAKAGFATLHGPNATSSWWENSEGSFKSLVFDGGKPEFGQPPTKAVLDTAANGEPSTEQPLASWPALTIGVGKARGKLLGGNLTVLNALVGTQYLPSFDGAILFIEDVDEAEYRIDRMLTQMGQAGILGKLSGFVFGQCTDCKAKDEVSGFPLAAILQQHIAPLGIPAFMGANFGHIRNQYCMPVGIEAEIDANLGTIRMLEPVVIT